MNQNVRWMLVLPPVGFARHVGLAVVKAFQQELSENVRVFDTQEVLQRTQSHLGVSGEGLALDYMNQKLLVQVLEQRVTHLLCLSSTPVDPHYLDLLRVQGIFVAHWLYEDYHLADYWAQVVGSYDLFCANQTGAVERHCLEKNLPYYFLPLGATQAVGGATSLWHGRSHDLAFVGVFSVYRAHVLEILSAAGLQLAIAGEGWDGYQGFLSRCIVPESANAGSNLDLFRQARMALHLSMGQGIQVGEDRPVDPLVWDSAALGAFPLVERQSSNSTNLIGLVYQEFFEPSELLSLCISLRQNGLESELLIENQRAIQERHTLGHRVRTFLGFVEDLGR